MLKCTAFIKSTTSQSGDKWKLRFSYDVILEIDYKGEIVEHIIAFALPKHEAVHTQKLINSVGKLIWFHVNEIENA